MFPQNSQIDLSVLFKDIYATTNSLVAASPTGENKSQNANGVSQNTINGLLLAGLSQQLQQQTTSQNLQQQQSQPQNSATAQQIQERINLYLQQQQIQLQQQQHQLSDLAALSAQLTSNVTVPTPTLPSFSKTPAMPSALNSDNFVNFSNGNFGKSGSNNLFSKENISSIPNANVNAANNSSGMSTNSQPPTFNFSPSAQNIIFSNLQSQLTALSNKSIQDSCSEPNSNISQSNQSQQKQQQPAFPNLQNANSSGCNTNDSILNSPNNKINQISSNQYSNGSSPKSINFNNTTHNPNGSNSGRWTREEHLRFVKGLGLYGKNWKKVEEFVGTRSGAQIRSHAQKFFNKIQRENAKNSSKQSGNGKGNNLHSNQMQDECLPSLRKRQQSTQSNYSCDLVSDDEDGDNDLQNQNQFADIIPEQSKQKDAKEWLHYYRLLQQTCQQNLDAQKSNLSADQIQQMEEQLKKIQIFIQVLSACENINQVGECASPMSQGSPMTSLLPFSFENLNINSPLMQASPGIHRLGNQSGQQNIEINTFSLEGNNDNEDLNKLPHSKTPNKDSLNTKSFGSIFKRLNEGLYDHSEQNSNSSEHSSLSKKKSKSENLSHSPSGGIIQSKLKVKGHITNQSNSESQMNEESVSFKSQNSKGRSKKNKKTKSSSYSVEMNLEDQQNNNNAANDNDAEDEEEASDQPTNRPNNLSNSAISSNDQNSTLSTPENQKLLNIGSQFGFNPNNSHTQSGQASLLNNIPHLGENIDIESDFSQVKNLANALSKNNSSESKLKSKHSQNHDKSSVVMPIASPPLESKKTPFFSASNTPIKQFNDITSTSTNTSSSKPAFKLEPSFFVFFMKRYGKYFNDPQTPSKLSDLVNMNTQQYVQDCVIEEFSIDKETTKKPSNSFSSASSGSKPSSPILKKRQAAERAQNVMELEEDYGMTDMPVLRKKQSSFSAYTNHSKGVLSSLCSNNNNNSSLVNNPTSTSANSSPLFNKYISNYQSNNLDEEKQLKIINFRKKLKTSDFTNNPSGYTNCLDQVVPDQNDLAELNQVK